MANSAHSPHGHLSTHRVHKGEPQPAKDALTPYWKQFRKRNIMKEEAKGPEVRCVFGVPLITSIPYANVAISLFDESGESYIYGYVPIVVAKCGVFLKEKATGVEGIFRLAGSTKRIKELRAQFDAPPRWGEGLDWSGYTVHDAANTLRQYFNQLPEPIVPLQCYDAFRAPLKGHQAEAVGLIPGQAPSIGGFNPDATVQIYQALIQELPSLNRQLLLYILDLLAVFAAKSDVNMMTTSNLAAIFQPGILSHPQHDLSPADYRLSQDVLIFLIDNQDHFLIGMGGTAVDEGTLKHVESGLSTPQTKSPTAHIKIEETIWQNEATEQSINTLVREPESESAGPWPSGSYSNERIDGVQPDKDSLPNHFTSAGEEENSVEEQPITFWENDTETLSPVKDLLKNGAAFDNLRTNLDMLVRPPQSRQPITEPPEVSESTTSAATWHREGRDGAIVGFFAALGFVERPLARGKKRIRWKCCCGEQLYDDYTELKVGALEDLRERLKYLATPRKAPARNGQGYSGTASAGGNQLPTLISGVSNLFSSARKDSSTGPQIPLHNKPTVGSSFAANGYNPLPDPLHLLVCMRDGKFGTSVHQEEISSLKNDRGLFQFLRDDYMRRRGRLYSLVSLGAPESIKLVKFNLISGKLVDVRKHELDCIQQCVCLPPFENVEPKPNAEYRCRPIPPNLCPPLGSELLMHLFSHPECLNDNKQAWILEQFPKKLHGELVGNPEGPVVGWGIYFKEGWNWVRIKTILLVYVIASLAFGIVWTVRRDDVQGAFGIAGYLASTATVFLGYVAMQHM